MKVEACESGRVYQTARGSRVTYEGEIGGLHRIRNAAGAFVDVAADYEVWELRSDAVDVATLAGSSETEIRSSVAGLDGDELAALADLDSRRFVQELVSQELERRRPGLVALGSTPVPLATCPDCGVEIKTTPSHRQPGALVLRGHASASGGYCVGSGKTVAVQASQGRAQAPASKRTAAAAPPPDAPRTTQGDPFGALGLALPVEDVSAAQEGPTAPTSKGAAAAALPSSGAEQEQDDPSAAAPSADPWGGVEARRPWAKATRHLSFFLHLNAVLAIRFFPERNQVEGAIRWSAPPNDHNSSFYDPLDRHAGDLEWSFEAWRDLVEGDRVVNLGTDLTNHPEILALVRRSSITDRGPLFERSTPYKLRRLVEIDGRTYASLGAIHHYDLTRWNLVEVVEDRDGDWQDKRAGRRYHLGESQLQVFAVGESAVDTGQAWVKWRESRRKARLVAELVAELRSRGPSTLSGLAGSVNGSVQELARILLELVGLGLVDVSGESPPLWSIRTEGGADVRGALIVALDGWGSDGASPLSLEELQAATGIRDPREALAVLDELVADGLAHRVGRAWAPHPAPTELTTIERIRELLKWDLQHGTPRGQTVLEAGSALMTEGNRQRPIAEVLAELDRMPEPEAVAYLAHLETTGAAFTVRLPSPVARAAAELTDPAPAPAAPAPVLADAPDTVEPDMTPEPPANTSPPEVVFRRMLEAPAATVDGAERRRVTRSELVESLSDLSVAQVGRALTALVADGRIKRVGRGRYEVVRLEPSPEPAALPLDQAVALACALPAPEIVSNYSENIPDKPEQVDQSEPMGRLHLLPYAEQVQVVTTARALELVAESSSESDLLLAFRYEVERGRNRPKVVTAIQGRIETLRDATPAPEQTEDRDKIVILLREIGELLIKARTANVRESQAALLELEDRLTSAALVADGWSAKVLDQAWAGLRVALRRTSEGKTAGSEIVEIAQALGVCAACGADLPEGLPYCSSACMEEIEPESPEAQGAAAAAEEKDEAPTIEWVDAVKGSGPARKDTCPAQAAADFARGWAGDATTLGEALRHLPTPKAIELIRLTGQLASVIELVEAWQGEAGRPTIQVLLERRLFGRVRADLPAALIWSTVQEQEPALALAMIQHVEDLETMAALEVTAVDVLRPALRFASEALLHLLNVRACHEDRPSELKTAEAAAEALGAFALALPGLAAAGLEIEITIRTRPGSIG